MKTFKITLKGRNYLLDFDGEPRKMGFTSVRYVRSTDPEGAERAVLRQIHCHPILVQESLNGKLDPPTVEVESITRSWFSHLFVPPSSGLDFFPEEEK